MDVPKVINATQATSIQTLAWTCHIRMVHTNAVVSTQHCMGYGDMKHAGRPQAFTSLLGLKLAKPEDLDPETLVDPPYSKYK